MAHGTYSHISCTVVHLYYYCASNCTWHEFVWYTCTVHVISYMVLLVCEYVPGARMHDRMGETPLYRLSCIIHVYFIESMKVQHMKERRGETPTSIHQQTARQRAGVNIQYSVHCRLYSSPIPGTVQLVLTIRRTSQNGAKAGIRTPSNGYYCMWVYG
jgi:hypothetical protein